MGLEQFFSQEGYRKNSPDRNRAMNIIPSGNISMKGVPHPVYGVDNMGTQKMMYPGYNYQFPGSQVTEFPVRQQGGNTANVEQRVFDPNNPNASSETIVYDQPIYDPKFQGKSYHAGTKGTGIIDPTTGQEYSEAYFTFGDRLRNFFTPRKDIVTPVFQHGGYPIQTGGGQNYEQMLQDMQDGGYIDMELTDAEIAQLRAGGYVVEEL